MHSFEMLLSELILWLRFIFSCGTLLWKKTFSLNFVCFYQLSTSQSQYDFKWEVREILGNLRQLKLIWLRLYVVLYTIKLSCSKHSQWNGAQIYIVDHYTCLPLALVPVDGCIYINKVTDRLFVCLLLINWTANSVTLT